MEKKFSNLGSFLTRSQAKQVLGGEDEGNCVSSTCEAKSTSAKSCKCSSTWDKCLCTTVYIEVEV